MAFLVIGLWSGPSFSAAIYLEPALTMDGFVSVPVALQVNPNEDVAGLQFDVDFDESLYTLVEVYTGSAVVEAGKDGVFTDGFPGTTRVLVTGMNQAAIPEGVVVTIILSPADPSVSGYLELNSLILSDPFGNRVIAELGVPSKESRVYESEGTDETPPAQVDVDATADPAPGQTQANPGTETPQHDSGMRRGETTPSPSDGSNQEGIENSKSNGSGARSAPRRRAAYAPRKPISSKQRVSDEPVTNASAPLYARSNEPGIELPPSRSDRLAGLSAEPLVVDAGGESASRIVADQMLSSHLDRNPANAEMRHSLALGLIVFVLAFLATFRGPILGFALELLPFKNQQRP